MTGPFPRDETTIERALVEALAFLTHRDHMNARVHLEEPRWSPITQLVRAALEALPGAEFPGGAPATPTLDAVRSQVRPARADDPPATGAAVFVPRSAETAKMIRSAADAAELESAIGMDWHQALYDLADLLDPHSGAAGKVDKGSGCEERDSTLMGPALLASFREDLENISPRRAGALPAWLVDGAKLCARTLAGIYDCAPEAQIDPAVLAPPLIRKHGRSTLPGDVVETAPPCAECATTTMAYGTCHACGRKWGACAVFDGAPPAGQSGQGLGGEGAGIIEAAADAAVRGICGKPWCSPSTPCPACQGER